MFSYLGAASRIGILTTTLLLPVGMAVAADAPAEAKAETLVEGDALAKNWNPPAYPADLKNQNVTGSATAEFIVDEKGAITQVKVVDATDPRFGEALVAAIKASTFQPAIDGGKAVASGNSIKWNFELPYKPGTFVQIAKLQKKPAVADVLPDPEYPASMMPLQRNGQVVCEIDVGADGSVTNYKVVSATDADFVVAGVPIFKQWKFKPAKQGDLVVMDKKIAPLTFEYDRTGANDPRTELEANGITLVGTNGEKVQPACDIEPVVIVLPQPVYPRELLKSGQGGEAVVNFTIDANGRTSAVHVDSATTPACGASLVASIETAVFKHAFTSGKPVPVDAQIKYVYPEIKDTAEDGESDETRLLREVKSGHAIASAKGLDGTLHPIWRAPATYPAALLTKRPKGDAEIEFVIDRHGRARIPQVMSATSDEFGWAAAVAVSQWVFDPPTRSGKPSDVRVRIPVHFDPPAQ
ncbi:MAG TPA: TonB family protein [Opitutaceae bacterium]|nr:TonB family protein [Opitutaceae bacterium]